MNVLTVPSSVEERTFDQLVDALPQPAERVLLDARQVRWVDPYGMLGLLAVGEVVARSGERPLLRLPNSAEVLSYLTRMDFFEHADRVFELHGGSRRTVDSPSDVLLEITPVRSHGDIHTVVDRVNQRAVTILTRQLHYPGKEAFQFSVILSEVCQNIVEHAEAGSGGWVATQTYNWARRLGRKVVVIAVMDLGVGFRGSLAGQHAARFGERWSDATALEAAFLHGLTRFHDPGRGQGLQQIRKQVGRWGGKISVRSGTARIADVPPWDDAPQLEERLAPFPGAQICIVLPARLDSSAPAATGGAA
ncbi:MAG: sensor histidine kinase [Gemmatimonadetes bacterium]|nr:sensor histidine kinase [Gemmatimonadota bacterium]